LSLSLLHHKEKPHYFQKVLPVTKPQGENIFEFAIVAEDKIGAFSSLVQVFTKHRIDIQSISANKMKEPNTKTMHFVAGLFCDLTVSDVAVEEVQSELKSLPFVIEVQSCDMKQWIWDRYFFPTNLAQSRIIMIRVEPLLRIERNLIQRLGTGGAAIMYREGEVYAEETFHEYKSMLPKANKERLLQCLVDGLRATGWGIVEFKKLLSGYQVTIKDPPMLKEIDYKENRFLYGAAGRTLELIFDDHVSLAESSFDEKNSILNLKYSSHSTVQ
jgi:predicted amino acid-binding ACT domain protein